MTLTLNQSDLYRFDRLIAKLVKPSAEAMVCFIPNSTGLKLAAFANNSILTMTLEKRGFVEPFSISITNSLGKALMPNWIIIAPAMPVLLAKNLFTNSIRNIGTITLEALTSQVRSNSNSLPPSRRRTNSTGGR